MSFYPKYNLDDLTPHLGRLCAPNFHNTASECRQIFSVPVAAVGLREGRHVRLFYSGEASQKLLIDDALCALPLCVPGEQILVSDLNEVDEALLPPLALALGMRSYAGVPIFAARQLVGSLSLADRKPRLFSHFEIQNLQIMAAKMGALMEQYL
ncbi:GAF domain-containing protein [Marinospirillum insulare]|uniref:GAF domain-containing protein n=1 Tax=Marinospirillum insulare TaxID=217169 RepID=A0ABQ5ZYX6_9GAMM|nr:GAF domain-containing protein [Marinospirillum insulare]GLR64230.1 hypothetical protein GCM10007878_16680 [Marinospirillum insulare]